MSNTISALDPAFTTLINSIMTVERQPLTRLTQKRDDITVQKSIYNDLKRMLDSLQTSVHTLHSQEPEYSFNVGYKTQVSGVSAGSTVLTASAGTSAIASTYNISVETLAREHRVRSDKQPGTATQALNLTGTFMIGLNSQRSQTTKVTTTGTVNGFDVAGLGAGQTELSSGSYYVETRQDAGTWQFRLIDEAGQAVAVNGSPAGDWQALPAGTFDTGRGLTIDFGTDPAAYKAGSFGSKANPAAQVTYSGQYAAITVGVNDSLIDIASRINKAKYPEGRGVSATVIDNQLILSANAAGKDNLLSAVDLNGSVLQSLGVFASNTFKNTMQTSANAVFYVNDLKIERTKNTGLTDVISGITLNLANDAQSKSAALEVTADPNKQTDTLKAFITNFNSTMSYLTSKVSTTKLANGSYQRGALSGDSMFSGLRQDLIQTFNQSFTNSGSLRTLYEMGLEMDDNFQISIKDSTKLDAALKNKNNITALMDKVMSQMDDKLSRFTGSSGYVLKTTASLDTILTNTNTQITQMNDRLSVRQEQLINQYAQVQAQLLSMSYMQQQLSSMYGSTNTYS